MFKNIKNTLIRKIEPKYSDLDLNKLNIVVDN